MAVIPDKDTIKETGNALSKISSSERGTFMFIMIAALLSIIGIVIFFTSTIDGLVSKYNDTINKQQTEFLTALKDITK